jgi:hypothetical protein
VRGGGVSRFIRETKDREFWEIIGEGVGGVGYPFLELKREKMLVKIK